MPSQVSRTQCYRVPGCAVREGSRQEPHICSRPCPSRLQGHGFRERTRGGGEGIPDLAHTAGLTQGADGSHVALVPGAEFRGVVAGRGVQAVAGRHVACSLQVALARREKKRREEAFCEHARKGQSR